MGISNSEHITRIGLFNSRATRVKSKMLLNIEHVIFINLYVSIKSKSIPLMVLFNFLKFYHDNVYIHLDRSNNTKQIVNYTPLHERDSYIHVSNLTSNQFHFACMIYFDFICTFILLMLSGDIESILDHRLSPLQYHQPRQYQIHS
jgi:hypothetical protein